MRSKMIVAVALLLAVVLSGCGKYKSGQAVQKPLTTEQLAQLKEYKMVLGKYEALPQSTIAALKAKNLVGKKLWCGCSDWRATDIVKVLIENGAKRSAKNQADFIIEKTLYPAGADKAIVIWDKDGNPFTYKIGRIGFYNPAEWAQDTANTLGTESKVEKLAELDTGAH